MTDFTEHQRKNMKKKLEILKNKISSKIWSDNQKDISPYLSEERGRIFGKSNLIIKPRNTLEVSEVLKICYKNNIKIVPQGGRTGLSGGTVPSKDGSEVIFSLEKMNKILNINVYNSSITVQSGCILSKIKNVAKKNNLYFPIDIASEEKCTIGGNIATNAGGTAVLKYGMTRDLILGLEVVLSNGTIIHGLRDIKKDNRGYDLKHLFIGAEGTLGIVTLAKLKLFPEIANKDIAIIAIDDIKDAINFLSMVKSHYSEYLSSYELNSSVGINLVLKHFPGLKLPFKNLHKWYVLLEFSCSNNDDLNKKILKVLILAKKNQIILDYYKPNNSLEKEEIWKSRKLLNQAQKLEGPSVKHDISLPIETIPKFLKIVEKKLNNLTEKNKIVIFGHLADGNLHYNVSKPKQMKITEFEKLRKEINKVVFDEVFTFGGSFSAEHGIGKFKIKELYQYSDKKELKVKKELKKLLDPKNIMNPGKIFY